MSWLLFGGVARAEHWVLFVFLLASTTAGSRREEMLGLRRKDVLLESGC